VREAYTGKDARGRGGGKSGGWEWGAGNLSNERVYFTWTENVCRKRFSEKKRKHEPLKGSPERPGGKSS